MLKLLTENFDEMLDVLHNYSKLNEDPSYKIEVN